MSVSRFSAVSEARVLIVEDIVFRAMEMEHVLTASGCKVVGYAYDLPSALKSAARDKPNVALVSLELNDQDGRADVVDSLSRLGVGCVVLTEGDPEHTDAGAAIACLHQPCRDDQVSAAVSTAYLRRPMRHGWRARGQMQGSST